MRKWLYLAGGNLLKLRVGAVEDIRITTVLVVIVELPDCVKAPASRKLTNLAVVACDNKGAFISKHGGVARASLPPASRGIDEGITASLGVVSVDEIVDPISHRSLAETVTSVAVGAILKVQHT